MSNPYYGEIRMFAGNFAPQGWAFCDGQLLAISDNDVLFSLIGTTYGGDGVSTFALPDLRGRLPLHQGQGSGLSLRRMGQTGGVENVTLTANQMPAHSHTLRASSAIAGRPTAQNNFLGKSTNTDIYTGDAPDGSMANTAITTVGGNQPHANIQPYQCINYIISLLGIYPSRQ